MELIHRCNLNYSLKLLKLYNYTYSISSMVVLLPTTAILVAMVFYKAYHTTLQRLFIYLTLSIMAYLATSSLSIQLQPGIFQQTGERLCTWTGYIQISANVCSLVISLEISGYLLYIVWHQIRGKPLPLPTKSQTAILELACLFVGVVIPTCLLAIRIDHYGVGGAICWVKLYSNSSCNDTSEAETLGMAIFIFYSVIMSVDLISYVVLVSTFVRLGCKFQQSRAQYMKTAKRTALLIALLVVYTVVQLASLVVVYLQLRKHAALSSSEVVFCVLTPLSQLIRPLAYLFYFNSIKKFRWQVAKSTAGEWWQLCCPQHFRLWIRGKRGTLMVNNLDIRSGDDYFTPSMVTTSHYESLG